jgi:hypothetical protein
MKIIVFGKTFDKASAQLDRLLKDIPEICFKSNKKFSVNKLHHVVLSDNTEYIAISANNSARGYKCDIAYVDMDISIDDVNNIVLPRLAVSKVPESLRVQLY